MDQRDDKLRIAIDATNNKMYQIVMQDCPNRDEFLKFSNEVVTKPELHEFKLGMLIWLLKLKYFS